MNTKRKNILTAMLVIVIIVIIGVVGYFGFEIIDTKITEKKSQEITDEFDTQIPTISEEELIESEMEQGDPNGEEQGGGTAEPGETGGSGGSGGTSKKSSRRSSSGGVYINGYWVVGTIRIPATGIKYSIFSSPTPGALERGVGLLYTTNGLNQPGNTVIAGHNYRNRQFFSKNKNLNNGSLIYIKDTSGVERTYKVYNKFVTKSEDASFYQRDTKNNKEITLTTCTDQGTKTGERLIIFAVEK